MLKFLIAACLAVLPVFAAPCTSFSTALDYQALGASGCEVGMFTIKNVSWTSTSTPPTPPLVEPGKPPQPYVGISASDVILTSLESSSGGVGLAFSSDKFDITGWQRINALLRYSIDPEPPPILDDFSLTMDTFTPVFPGFAKITAAVCAGDYFSNGCFGGSLLPLLTVYHNGTDSDKLLSVTEKFPTPVNIVDVQLFIEMAANGASSSITGATGFSETIVPEPAAGLLAGLGLVLLAGIRRIRNS